MNIQTNIQKVKYLRLLMDSLKGGWEFTESTDCPCGHLAQIVSGVNEGGLRQMIFESPLVCELEMGAGPWETSVVICTATGRVFPDVVKDLLNAGFTGYEICSLEKAALKAIPENRNQEYIFDFIQDWRSRIISETETLIAEASAELSVEKLLMELVKEKESLQC